VVKATSEYSPPPLVWRLPASDDYSVEIRTRTGGNATAMFSIMSDPRQLPLESVYRPERSSDEIYIGGSLEIPEGFAIDAVVSLDTSPPTTIRLFGRGDRTTSLRSRKVRAGAVRRGEVCVYEFMQIPHTTRRAVTIDVRGVIIDRLDQRHTFHHNLTADFRNELVSVSLDVGFDGTVRFSEVPG
jgi:hypothetical protein